MQTQIDTKTSWSDDEVKETVEALVCKRHGLDYETYVRMVQQGDEAIDRCRDSDILGLLALTGINSRNRASCR
ncbi:MAG: hypothetical protein WC714_23180 [Candidatus Obscuribacterales bacterium]|jgi:hypothetical protein